MQAEGKSQEQLKISAQKLFCCPFSFGTVVSSTFSFFFFFSPGAVDQISGGQQLPFEDSSDLLKAGGHPEKPAAAWAARSTQALQSQAGCCVSSQAGVRKGQKESRRSQCLSVSNHADKNLTTPSAQQKFLSPSIYPYNITIRASGHLLSLSKQKSSLKTLVMQVMA